jgi:transcriptional regulator with XRE-family HTH domain
MAGQGRKPNLKRRALVRRLRAKGLTFQKIAQRLGITRQAAHQLADDGAGPPPIHCRQCATLIATGLPETDGVKNPPLCLTCLAGVDPDAFGERLRALRLARGLTRSKLAAASGVTIDTIRAHERLQSRKPYRPTIVRLTALLGPALQGRER